MRVFLATRVAIGLLAAVIPLQAGLVHASPERRLMPFHLQESWLSYAFFNSRADRETKLQLICIREDNYLFDRVDPSFAIRHATAAYILARLAIEAGNWQAMAALSRELRVAARSVPAGVFYRFPVLVIGQDGSSRLEQPLPGIPGELPVSRAATRRWNSRLPLEAEEVGQHARAPFVITRPGGTCLSWCELVAGRKQIEQWEKALQSELKKTGISWLKLIKTSKHISSDKLTEILRGMVIEGSM